jgi:hypothetical protein
LFETGGAGIPDEGVMTGALCGRITGDELWTGELAAEGAV